MRQSRAINWVAGLTMLGAAVGYFFSVNEWPPSPDRKFHAALGQLVGREALRWLKPGGSVVAIVRDTSAFKHPESDYQFRGFEAALREAGTTIGTIQSLQVDPLRQLEVPAGDFFELIRKARAGSVIVSFMGPPLLDAEQRARLAEGGPAVVAFCPGALPRRVDLRELIEAGLLHAAVVETPSPEPGSAATSTRDGRPPPEARYQVVRSGDWTVLDAYRKGLP